MSDDQSRLELTFTNQVVSRETINEAMQPFIGMEITPDLIEEIKLTLLAIPVIDVQVSVTTSEQTCCQGGPQWGHAWDCQKLP
jgi:hypothetical protein